MDSKRHDTEKLKPEPADASAAPSSAAPDPKIIETTVYSAKPEKIATPIAASDDAARATTAPTTSAAPVIGAVRVETPSTVVPSTVVHPTVASLSGAASMSAGTMSASALDDEPVAAHYITRELSQARKSLRNTQIFGSLLVLGTLAYMSYMALNFRESLQPQAAAEIAGSLINQRVQEQATGLADQVKQRVPGLIAQLPDYALKQMPQYRKSLETQIESDLNTHCAKAATDLDAHIDDFLAENKDKIKAVLADTQNPAVIKELGGSLQKEFLSSLKKMDGGGGETMGVKIDKSLGALREINTKMRHLANNKNLTPQEKKARRALAIMVGTVNRETKGVQMPAKGIQMPTKISFDTSR